MSKRLPVPPELESLIEKREQEKDRRAQKRRAESGDAKGSADRATKGHGGPDRRQSKDRRQKPRRKR